MFNLNRALFVPTIPLKQPLDLGLPPVVTNLPKSPPKFSVESVQKTFENDFKISPSELPKKADISVLLSQQAEAKKQEDYLSQIIQASSFLKAGQTEAAAYVLKRPLSQAEIFEKSLNIVTSKTNLSASDQLSSVNVILQIANNLRELKAKSVDKSDAAEIEKLKNLVANLTAKINMPGLNQLANVPLAAAEVAKNIDNANMVVDADDEKSALVTPSVNDNSLKVTPAAWKKSAYLERQDMFNASVQEKEIEAQARRAATIEGRKERGQKRKSVEDRINESEITKKKKTKDMRSKRAKRKEADNVEGVASEQPAQRRRVINDPIAQRAAENIVANNAIARDEEFARNLQHDASKLGKRKRNSPREANEGDNLDQSKKQKGAGLIKKPRKKRVGKPSDRSHYKSLGDWKLDSQALEENVFNIRYGESSYQPFKSIPTFGVCQISDSLKEVLTSLIYTQSVSNNLLANLNEHEKEFLNRLVKRSKATFSIPNAYKTAPKPKRTMYETSGDAVLLRMFKIKLSSIMSGNDSPQLRRELKQLTSHLLAKGLLDIGQVDQVTLAMTN